jgi:hypothetical protein
MISIADFRLRNVEFRNSGIGEFRDCGLSNFRHFSSLSLTNN